MAAFDQVAKDLEVLIAGLAAVAAKLHQLTAPGDWVQGFESGDVIGTSVAGKI